MSENSVVLEKESRSWVLVFLVALPSLLALLFVPVTWNYYDSVNYLIWEPLNVLPGWPPLYPAFVQFLHNFATYGFEIFWNAPAKRTPFTDAGIYTAIAAQHLLYCASLLYLVQAASTNPRRQIVAVLLVSSSFALIPYVHGFYSEGLSIPPALFQLGALMYICRGKGGASHYSIYTVAFTLNVFVRSANVLFAAVGPLTLFFIVLFRFREMWRSLLIIVLLTVISLVFSSITLCWLTVNYGQGKDSTIGRTATYRLSDIWEHSSEKQRRKIVRRLSAYLESPALKEALYLTFSTPGPWWGPYNEVEKLVQQTPELQSKWNADEILNHIWFLYLRHPDRALYDSFMRTFRHHRDAKFGNALESCLVSSQDSIKLYTSSSYDFHYLFENLKVTDLSSLVLYQRLSERTSRGWHVLSTLTVTFVILIIAGLLYLCGEILLEQAALLLSCTIVAWTSLALLSLLTGPVMRYGVISAILLLTGIVILCGAGKFRLSDVSLQIGTTQKKDASPGI